MKNMEREKFEESWKRAFEKAEVTPSQNVWTNIELDLEKARGGELKKRLMFYKMLAAACVVFAMAVGGVGYYYTFTPNASGDLAVNSGPSFPADAPSVTELSESSAEESYPQESKTNSTTDIETETESREALKNSDAQTDLSALRNTNSPPTSPMIANKKTDSQSDTPSLTSGKEEPFAGMANEGAYPTSTAFKSKEISPLYTPREIRLTIPKERTPEIDPVVAMLAKLEQREREVQGKEEQKKSESGGENLWTSVGFAAGSFNAMQSSSAAMSPSQGTASLAAPIVDQESRATGYSYTMGVNVGTKLSERWVFQGGVNYLTHSSEYTANNVVMESMGKYQQQRFRAASTNDLVNADEAELSNKLVYSAPYNVNNSMRYLSIPMQAGYLLINKTFGLQLNAGVATDLFLQNTLKPESDQLAKTSQPSGADSPYRAVNLSGLVGTEFSYRFGPHYRVSLNPGIRYPFSTIYKSELGVQSTPLTFDVGLRFRYIFH